MGVLVTWPLVKKCLKATGLTQFTQLWSSAFWEQTCLEERIKKIVCSSRSPV